MPEKNGKVLPRIMIAAPGSGSGKTMITCGILKILQSRMRPVAFKCGPDYIDPMFHRSVLGIPSRNLDTFFTEPNVTRYLMGRAADKANADIAVIEGVMGYYDGLGGISTKASSYELSVQTATPVILVVNGRGMSLSIAAVIRGFLELYPDQQIGGVILNRVSKMIYERLKPELEKMLNIVVIGYVPETEVMTFPSRHLGLLMPDEISHLQEQLKTFGELLQYTLDVDKIIEIAGRAPALPYDNQTKANANWQPGKERIGTEGGTSHQQVRIGLAMDEAFCFYYEDNLDLLKEIGAELVPFSPMRDGYLPDGISGLYMGGGYPELHAQILSENKAMHRAIREAIASGMPCLAECGAYMYLHDEMEDNNGRFWPMAAVIPGRAEKKGRLVRFGYTMLTAQEDTILGPAGMRLPAHEFHYWDTTDMGGSFLAEKPLVKRSWLCMHHSRNLLAGFPHLYFYGNVDAARNYMTACSKYGNRVSGLR